MRRKAAIFEQSVGLGLCDVVIIGGGPVGRCAALALGQRGYSVVLLEQISEPFTIPRACFFDHEIARIFHALGVGEAILDLACPIRCTTFFNQNWKVLFENVIPDDSVSGGPLGYTFYQPKLEALLDQAIQRSSHIRVLTGHRATALSQSSEVGEVTYEFGTFIADERWEGEGRAHRLRSKYVIGADVAPSLVRQQIGAPWHNLGFEADWLVVDVDPVDGWSMAHLDPCRWCNLSGPTTLVPTGHTTRR